MGKLNTILSLISITRALVIRFQRSSELTQEASPEEGNQQEAYQA